MEKVDVIVMLEELADKVENAKNLPFSTKCGFDRDELLKYIEDIRLGLPDEITRCKYVIADRDQIIEDAKKQADEMIKEAEEKIAQMATEHEVTQRAYEQAQTLMAQANEYKMNTINETHRYCESLLESAEHGIMQAVDYIRQSKQSLKNQ